MPATSELQNTSEPPATEPPTAAAQMEQAYEALARAIDRAGPEHESLFLAKLALALAHQLADPAKFGHGIEVALADLPPPVDIPLRRAR